MTTIEHIDHIYFLIELAKTSVITFYREKEPIEQFAARKAGFARVLEELKRLADAGDVELFADANGHHARVLKTTTIASPIQVTDEE
jgi:hypothetical protein